MWLELSIRVPYVFYEIVTIILFEEGASGISEEISAAAGNIASLKAYFPSESYSKTVSRIKERISFLSYPGKNDFKKIKIEWSILEVKDWNSEWKKYFKPVKVSKRFLIVPPWHKNAAHGKRTLIIINPGQGFGTGTHESTRICLSLIENICDRMKHSDLCSFLDIGTGSGILAIAAAKEGFRKCTGIDKDAEAIENARENITLNRLGMKIYLKKASPENIKNMRFDSTAANMILSEHIEVCPHYKYLIKPQGLLAISGLMKGQEKEFLSLPDISMHFKKVKSKTCNEWIGLLLEKKYDRRGKRQ